MSHFDSSEISSSSLRQGLENLFKVLWLSRSSLEHPRTWETVANLDRKSGPTYSAFHLLIRHYAGLLNSLIKCPMCIWACCLLHGPLQLRRPSPDACTLRLYYIYCDFSLWPKSESSCLSRSPLRNHAGGDLGLESCVHQPVQGKV